ncbi:hypothetical protein BH23CHL8_BH23CHL8_30270 [soil metagenome]
MAAQLSALSRRRGRSLSRVANDLKAIEWGLELQSADRDFARYPGLRWRDPIA